MLALGVGVGVVGCVSGTGVMKARFDGRALTKTVVQNRLTRDVLPVKGEAELHLVRPRGLDPDCVDASVELETNASSGWTRGPIIR